MTITHFVNLTWICNERCVFCAADLAHGPRLERDSRDGVALDHVVRWIETEKLGPDDEVAIAGGEPTLHRQFLPIVRQFAQRGCRVTLFTNGLRLADPTFARSVIDAGVSRIEIGLFGSS